LNLNSHRV